MQLRVIIGLAVAVIVGLLVFQITRLEKKIDAQNETIGIQAASIVDFQKTIEHQKESAKKAKEHQNELDQLRQANARAIESVSNQLAMEKAKNFSLAQSVPFDAGNNITRRFAYIMCEKERAGTSDSGTCDIHTPVSEDASVNFAQVITPQVAEQWKELCEAGQRDYCNYVMVAFSWDGVHNLLDYLMKDLLATQALYANDAYFRQLLDSNEEDK